MEFKAKLNSENMFNLNAWNGKFLFLLSTVFMSSFLQYLLQDAVIKNYSTEKTSSQPADSAPHPKYAIYGKSRSDNHLKHIHTVLQHLGLRQVSLDEDWDLLWAHDYPFNSVDHLKMLTPHRRVNHIPGCGYITNKVDLSISESNYIPPAFKLPEDKEKFKKYFVKYPNKLFVQKHNQHRHIYIKAKEEIDLTSNVTFIQEFIDNPYLVDGHKFDIGVYVIITSIDPLRVYVYKGDVLFRFCSIQYHPFDPKIVDKYIVGDDYLPTWKIRSLAKYYNRNGFGMKESFDAYVRSQGHYPAAIWEQVEDAIRTTILDKEHKLIEIIKNYKSKRMFFEMMRFDFFVDHHLKVYLMEANMSPNLSSAHFKQNRNLYEQVLYSLLNLVGIGSPLQRHSFKPISADVEGMISTNKNIAVQPELCSNLPCTTTCEGDDCQLCVSCLGSDKLSILHSTVREHFHKIDTKRIFPVPIINPIDFDLQKAVMNLSSQNKFITRWFYEKCRMDILWCF